VITRGVPPMKRMYLLTYEPSYYSTMLMPFFVYALFRFLQNPKRNWTKLALGLVPLLLSYSFGAISGLIVSLLFFSIFYWRRLLLNKWFLIVASVGIPLALVVALASGDGLAQTSFAVRLGNVVSGDDSSGNARTVIGYVLAYRVAEMKSVWWGVGLGRTKDVAKKLVSTIWDVDKGVSIPNSMGATLAEVGILGILLRFGLEIYLFRKTKVSKNYYRFVLFGFAFVTQFTAGFLSNLAEYVIWILAFSNVFPEFNVDPEPETEALPEAPPLTAEAL
jgi:hypothetical protein